MEDGLDGSPYLVICHQWLLFQGLCELLTQFELGGSQRFLFPTLNLFSLKDVLHRFNVVIARLKRSATTANWTAEHS
jgi:hypothetical protein